jgi:hypothetical protein
VTFQSASLKLENLEDRIERLALVAEAARGCQSKAEAGVEVGVTDKEYGLPPQFGTTVQSRANECRADATTLMGRQIDTGEKKI